MLQRLPSYLLQRVTYATSNEQILQRMASDFSQRATSAINNVSKFCNLQRLILQRGTSK